MFINGQYYIIICRCNKYIQGSSSYHLNYRLKNTERKKARPNGQMHIRKTGATKAESKRF